ncbi:MAG: T9SS type A sorting domain-containing protein [Bacteroidota bacterium]
MSLALALALLGSPVLPDDCPERSRASALVLVPADPAIAVGEAPLEEGDILTAVTPTGACAGSAVWTSEGAVIAVWEDDPFTPLLDGMLDGDPLTFQAYDVSEGSPAVAASVQLSAVHGGADGFASDDLYVVDARATSGPQAPEAAEALVLGPSFPNPLQTTTTIPVVLGEEARVTVDVFDALGRRVLQALDRDLPAGGHRVEVDASDLAPGLYLYRVTAGEHVDQASFTVAR